MRSSRNHIGIDVADTEPCPVDIIRLHVYVGTCRRRRHRLFDVRTADDLAFNYVAGRFDEYLGAHNNNGCDDLDVDNDYSSSSCDRGSVVVA